MEKLYHLTAPDAGLTGNRTSLHLSEWQAEKVLEEISDFLSKDSEIHPHTVHPGHIRPRSKPIPRLCHLVVHHRENHAPWKLVLDRQCATWAHEALSDVLARQEERTPARTVGRVNVNASVINQGQSAQPS